MRAMATAGLGFVTVGGGALALDMALFRAAGLYVCPELCSVSGPKTGNWTRFVSNEDLKWCTNQTMLLSLPVYTPLADDSSHSVFYACLSSRGNEVEERVKDVEKRAVQGRIVPSKVGFLQSRSLGRSPNFVGDASAAIKELQAKYLDVPNTDTNQTMYFAKRGDAAVGVYVGGDVQKQGIAATLMQRLDQHLGSGSPPARTALFQLCGDGRNADSVAGVVADGRGGLDSVFAVQEFVRTWAESRCVADMEGSRTTETCGTTREFCVPASLGPPGTAKPGSNGCISHCGMDIVNNAVGPASQMVLGYFEAWNYRRGCLHMDVTQMSKSITHVHFAFVDVTAGFVVSTAQVQEQWDKFKGLAGHHKVVAFGGWAASTEPTSYWIFREGVKPGNRERLASNLADFILANNMDGIDLDWEYPGAQDIPGIPAADPFDGKGYLELLKLLRQKLGKDKTISIAAPASYWYLQNFPIEEMSKTVDYIVYMTYDLHGQWDYNSKWSMPGCGETSCLRSHINMTETLNSLSMITKAGVPSYKIVVGVSSYGRSFEMASAACTGPQCGFTGPASTAKKGRCTDTHGYVSNAEIDEIIRLGSAGSKRATGVSVHTDDSDSQILVYDGTQWVAFMDDANKARRKARWADLNFAGITDWAVDLKSFAPGDDNPKCWHTHCEAPGATDTREDDYRRWKALCSDQAWDEAMAYYKRGRDRYPGDFSKNISNFFHGLSNMNCDVLTADNECHENVPCIQGRDTGPAATFILNSFVAMSNTLWNLYEGIQFSQQTLDSPGNLATFVKTFAPDPQEDLALNIILNIVSFGLSAATGPFFNSCKLLRNTPWGKNNKDTNDNLKDTLQAVMSFSFSTAKDAKSPDVPKEAAASTQLAAIVRHYKVALTEVSKQLFSGSDKGIEVLHKVIGDGKLLQLKPTGMLDLEQKSKLAPSISKLFYAMLIPAIWRMKGWKPVLVDTGTNCDNDETIRFLSKDSPKVCVDGKRYHLARPDGAAMTYTSAASQNWGNFEHFNKLQSLDGFKELTGGAWADLRREDLVTSIVGRTKVNWKNPSSDESRWPDFTDGDQFDKMWGWINTDNMIQSPGLVDIPMCGMDEILNNWKLTKNEYYSWPCNRP
ncbi:Glycoside hydrolase [Ophiocordyceps sinensis CO18]|uniref:chitinase n=1 Tax=Ophiocordyceps sinensis (strain Co18 / CGMCC 3.14243) TaxID=911162 RepID=T5AJS3_OPHSC|nr:Glycoside hydrolase [Ophiocordyceps sinensis CO18]